MADYTADLTGSWTPALASDALYRALRRAQRGKTTLFTSDGHDIAVIGPPELDPDTWVHIETERPL